MIRRFIREPLLHFGVLGVALFAAYGLVATPAADHAEIVVTSDRIASLGAQFSAMRGGRPPTDAELRALIDAYVRDEMLYREGLALGLDRDDPVVRNRVRQKADFLSTDALTVEPTDAQLQAYLDAHRQEFDIPGRVSFDQVYFDPARHRHPVEAVAAAGLKALTGGAAQPSVGDRTLLPATVTRAMPTEIKVQFGAAFEKQLAGVPTGGWHGPLASAYGAHLVRVTRREAPTRATLANARDVVVREWSRSHTVKRKEEFLRTLALRYTVRIDPFDNASQVAAAEPLR
jgi:hypothetical protein